MENETKIKYPPLIKNTKKPNTVQSLCSDFGALGINKGDVALVHASLSKLGWVCTDQSTVVLALKEAFGDEGTIVMPAHTASNSDPAEWRNPPVPKEWQQTIRDNMPAYDKHISPSESMGVIAECFRCYPGTLRSDNPYVSFTANGKLAEEITKNHVLTPFFGMDTPLGALYKLDAKVLFIGTDYNSCTAFHLSEVLWGKLEIIKNGCAMYRGGERIWQWYDDYDYDSDDFEHIGYAFESTGAVHKAKVGMAECRLFSLKSAVDFALEWMKKYR